MCSALCTDGSAVSAVIRLDAFTRKAKEEGHIWTHLFPLAGWYTLNPGVKLDVIRRCLRTVRDCSGGVSVPGLGFCLAQTPAIRLCGVSPGNHLQIKLLASRGFCPEEVLQEEPSKPFPMPRRKRTGLQLSLEAVRMLSAAEGDCIEEKMQDGETTTCTLALSNLAILLQIHPELPLPKETHCTLVLGRILCHTLLFSPLMQDPAHRCDPLVMGTISTVKAAPLLGSVK